MRWGEGVAASPSILCPGVAVTVGKGHLRTVLHTERGGGRGDRAPNPEAGIRNPGRKMGPGRQPQGLGPTQPSPDPGCAAAAGSGAAGGRGAGG